MNTSLTEQQIASCRHDGYVMIENFLTGKELNFGRSAVTEAIGARKGRKLPNRETRIGENDSINQDASYFGKVFAQMPNMWQTSEDIRQIVPDEKIGKTAALLPGWKGTRIWHDRAPNMTNGFRRAMTCAFMSDGATCNGIQNILDDEQVAKLQPDDLLNDDTQNPLIYQD